VRLVRRWSSGRGIIRGIGALEQISLQAAELDLPNEKRLTTTTTTTKEKNKKEKEIDSETQTYHQPLLYNTIFLLL